MSSPSFSSREASSSPLSMDLGVTEMRIFIGQDQYNTAQGHVHADNTPYEYTVKVYNLDDDSLYPLLSQIFCQSGKPQMQVNNELEQYSDLLLTTRVLSTNETLTITLPEEITRIATLFLENMPANPEEGIDVDTYFSILGQFSLNDVADRTIVWDPNNDEFSIQT